MSLGGLIDAAASALGAGDKSEKPKTAPKLTGKPVFVIGEAISVQTTEPTAAAPQNVNALDNGPIEFVHFGHTHADLANSFPHDKLDDTAAKFPEGMTRPGHAHLFRAALMREAILLHNLAGGLKDCMAECKKAFEGDDKQGGVGQLLGAAMSAVSGTKDDAPKPSPDDVKPYLEAIEKAGGLVSGDAAKYPDIHKSGKNLHQARADFKEYCDKSYPKLVKKEGQSSGGGGAIGSMASQVPGGGALGGALGAVGGVIQTVTNYVTKAFDIYLGMHMKLREKYQSDIEKACYKLSMKAVIEPHAPVFPIWFPPPGAKEDAEKKKKEEEQKRKEEEEGTFGFASKAKHGVEDAVSDAEGFLGFEKASDPAYGEGTLSEIFAALAPKEVHGAPVSASSACIEGFKDALGGTAPPGFVVTVIEELTNVSLAMLARVYRAILMSSAGTVIDEASLKKAGREALTPALIATITRLIGTDFFSPQNKFVGVQGKDLTGQNLSNIARDLIDKGLGAQLEMVADLCMGKLAIELERVRKDAADNKHATMEVFVGRLPYFVALLVRNTFFPVWELLIKTVFGKAGEVAMAAMSPMKSMLSDAGGVADDIKEKKDTAEAVQKNLAKGVDLTKIATDPSGFAKGLTEDPDKKKKKDEDAAAGGASFPGSARKPECKGEKVTKAQDDEVRNNQKVDAKPSAAGVSAL